MEVHLIGEAPEKKGDNNRAPQLCHHIEEAEAPVTQNGDRCSGFCADFGNEVLTKGCRSPSHAQLLAK